MHIRIDADTKGLRSLDDLRRRMADPRPVLEEMGLVLLRSVARNFKEGGRPERWKPSKRALAEPRGKTLIDTGRLRNSITMKVEGDAVKVGTNVEYAAIHQFGGRIDRTVLVRAHRRLVTQAFGRRLRRPRMTDVRGHARRMRIEIPARPFLVVQDGDWKVLSRIVSDYVRGEGGSAAS